MEILLEQRFRQATIILMRSYCKLADFQLYKYNGSYDRKTSIISTDFSGEYTSKKNTLFFKENKPPQSCNELYEYPKFEVVKEHQTMSDKQITRHYNNPFATVRVNILERSIKKKVNKIIITNSEYIKERRFNCKYFKSVSSKTIFTFDFDSGNFQIIHSSYRGKKQLSKTFRTNNFILLNEVLKSRTSFFKMNRHSADNTKFIKEIENSINNQEFYNVISKAFNIDFFMLNKSDGHVSFYKKIMEKFIELRRIKIPNHSYEHLLEYNYPKEKLLKKNDRKLIASVLDLYGIKSKYTIKLLHNYPFLNLIALTKLSSLFGNDYHKYLSSINEKIYSVSQTHEREVRGLFSLTDYKEQVQNYNISDIEKENIIRILNDEQFQKPITEDVTGQLFDHFRMIDAIRVYDTSIKMKAKTQKEFNDEHRELSKTIAAINKGWVIEYVYDTKTIESIQEYISIDENTNLYPHILKREEEYVEEGKFMHHCVASYADHEKSIIISIRTDDSSNRVTCEFDIQTGRLVQARHFCNGVPPSEFNEPIEVLKDKLRLMARYGTLNWKEKRKAAVLINGKEVESSGPTRITDNWFGLY